MSLDGIFLCSSGWSCTYYITEADLELLSIALIQSPGAKITGVSQHTQLIQAHHGNGLNMPCLEQAHEKGWTDRRRQCQAGGVEGDSGVLRAFVSRSVDGEPRPHRETTDEIIVQSREGARNTQAALFPLTSNVFSVLPIAAHSGRAWQRGLPNCLLVSAPSGGARESVSVSLRCWNKSPQVHRLKAIQLYSPRVLEVRSLKVWSQWSRISFRDFLGNLLSCFSWSLEAASAQEGLRSLLPLS